MNMHVASLEPGASSLPAELRIRRGDNQTVYGHDRLVMGQRFGHLGFVRPGLPRGWGSGSGEGMHGIGDFTFDGDDTPYVDTTYQPVYMPTESPYPVVMDSGPTMIQTNPASPNYGQLVSQSTGALANILAISQGGSVTSGPRGTVVQGSTQGAVTGAAAGSSLLNVGAGGVQALTSNTGLLVAGAIGVALLFMMNRR